MAANKDRKKMPGTIYVVTNNCYKKVFSRFNMKSVQPVKIGRSKDCLTRLGNMSAGVFDDYKFHLILHAKKDVVVCEDDIHQQFDGYRIYSSSGSKTEFFRYPIAEAIKRIKRFVDKHDDIVEIVEDNGVDGKVYGRTAAAMKKNNSVQGQQKKGRPKAKATTFKVKFPGGECIEASAANEVFVRAIEKFGPRKVAALGFKALVARTEKEFGARSRGLKKLGKWYVSTHSSTDSKMHKIKSIAKKLGVSVVVSKGG